jgi:hypothetical protein
MTGQPAVGDENAMQPQVELYLADRQPPFLRAGRGGPHPEADPGHQLRDGERLAEEVGRAGLQACDPNADLRHCGQYEDALLRTGLDDLFENLGAAHPGQHEIENDEIEVVGQCRGEALRSRCGMIDDMSVVA